MRRFKIILIAVAVLSLIAASAYGTATISTMYTFSGSSMTFAPSSNVILLGLANQTQYSAVSKHLNGDKTYGATSTSTTLFVSTAIAAGTALEVADGPSASDSTAFTTGWTSL